jgi:transposase
MQERLFDELQLKDHVPSDHLLRATDRFVDCSASRQHLAGFHSTTGRPSVDPELMIRMLLIGYCLAIRSERRLCEEAHLNLARLQSIGEKSRRGMRMLERTASRFRRHGSRYRPAACSQ